MEKTFNFAVFKEKIIKTNELLGVLSERNKSLEKSQEWNRLLKTRLELSKNEITKLRLRHDTLSYELTALGKKYDVLSTEHDRLKEQFAKLENESNNTINNLQVNYQLASQELKECKQKLDIFKEFDDPDLIHDQISPCKRKKSPPKKKKTTSEFVVMSKKINDLQAEKEKLLGQKSDLQLEVYELKKELNKFQCLQTNDEKEECVRIKEELEQVKSSFKATVGNKDKEIEKLTKEIKNVEKQKDSLQADNERLKIEYSLLQEETSELQKKDERNKQKIDNIKKLNLVDANIENQKIKELSKEIKNLEQHKDHLKAINEKMKDEISVLQLKLSKLEEISKQEEETNIATEHTRDVPLIEDDIVELVGPPSETIRDNNKTPSDEEICEIMKNMTVPSRMSPLAENSFYDERSRSPFLHHTNESPPPSIVVHDEKPPSPVNLELKKIVNRRRNYLRRQRQIARKRFKKVDLYGALVALKKANINFVITNNSLVSSYRGLYHSKSAKFKFEKKKNIITKELKCSLPCCERSYMVLKEDDETGSTNLLGFLDVKNETNVQKESEVCKDHYFPFSKSSCRSVKKHRLKTVPEKKAVGELNSDVTDNILGDVAVGKGDNLGICEENENIDNLGRCEENLQEAENNVIQQKLNEKRKERELDEIEEINEDEETFTCTQNKAENLEVRKSPRIVSRVKNLKSSNRPVNKHRLLKSVPEKKTVNELNNDSINNIFGDVAADEKVDNLEIREENEKVDSLGICEENSQEDDTLQLPNNVGNKINEKRNKRQLDQTNRDDETLALTQTKAKSPLEIRKSPRKKSRLLSMLKKRKVKDKDIISVTQFPDLGSNFSYKNPFENLSESCSTKPPKNNIPEIDKVQDFIFKKPATVIKSPKTAYKRPVCSTRRSPRLSIETKNDETETCDNTEEKCKEEIPLESPQSPTANEESECSDQPVVIPLEKFPEVVEKMPTTKIEVLFNKLILYSAEEEALNEVVREFMFQQPGYIAE